MIIALQKRKENIVEYLIYMWQIADLIRACQFNMDEIEESILSKYDQPEETLQEIREWYEELMDRMSEEGIMEKGDLQQNKDLISELNALHLRLLKSPKETVYGALYFNTLPAIVQLRSKSVGREVLEIETCLTAIYGYLLLKLQNKTISGETSESIKQISSLLAYLAARFHEKEVSGLSEG
jgi:hypothetical protein